MKQQYVEAYVIQADVPLLLGLNTMKKWRTMVDLESEQLIFRSLDITVNLRRNNRGHLTVPLEKLEEWSTTDTVMYMKNENEVCSLEKIKKVHINTNYKSEENLLHAHKQSNHLTDEVGKCIKVLQHMDSLSKI